MKRRLPAMCVMFFAVAAQAGGPAGGPVNNLVVSDAWVRAMPPVAKTSAGYLRIENRGDRDDELLGARVAGAGVTEIHEMSRSADGSMLMRRFDHLRVPAHGSVTLAPGGLHLMLFELQAPLRAGEARDAVLRFRDGGEVQVRLDVRPPG